jgi:peptide/nickel transport system substrate-binding protein
LDFNKIVAKHWGEADVDNSIQKWENQMGSGPFTPGSFKKDVSVELVKNENYWKEGLPYIDGMTHFKMVDKGTLIAAYKTEQVLMTNWAVTQLSNKEASQLASEEVDRLRVEFVQNCCFFFFFMNTSKSPFDNPKVRQAVNLALDRRALFETFGAPGIDTFGPAMGSGTWFGRTQEEVDELPGWRELNGEKHPDDIARAKELLAEAGFPDGFDVDMMVRQVVEFPDQAVMEKEDLKKIGINATIGLQDSGTGFKRYLDGDWIMATQGSAHFVIQPDAIFGRTFMPAGSWARYARYTPPQWFQDDYVTQAGEPDREKRKAILRKMDDFLIYEDPGCCPITYWTARNWVFNNKIKGIHRSGSLWAGYKHETTYCDPKC